MAYDRGLSSLIHCDISHEDQLGLPWTLLR